VVGGGCHAAAGGALPAAALPWDPYFCRPMEPCRFCKLDVFACAGGKVKRLAVDATLRQAASYHRSLFESENFKMTFQPDLAS